ncbi:MAG: glycerol dehydrogenase [Clostridium sp.]|jgi:glycerol dehydrogenase|uniref:glycerol dehydrogenase n=1 Tax=Clostridium sp. TaxID=1506 RepID=UPI0025C554F8|nr:glycerol dehydrogenase [Clostridium sp.]MCH3963177.1 glycerol dehydrogenase [Clostridium sp.]MCI1716360.1 glycerol dehydrogenase [Clostridium sp.]MCI1800700.1 glycerol dehydrogenase [Clostridium sp.]MCI1814645.1 glycerol dehydrogenase [Clostridium sp.]MCI1871555.1 glycerol dehydrogenase [Clostridium sp.]
MSRIIISTGKYVQGNGELANIYNYVKDLGNNFFIIASKNGIGRTKLTIENSFKEKNCSLTFETFNGECSKNEIDRLCKRLIEAGSNVVVGIGGGKIFDTAKAVAHFSGIPVVIVPTIAATDAPCSALSVIYTDDGIFSEYLFLPKNPDVVLVDSSIISKAPVRLLVAGMGDALATYFEARACVNSGVVTMAGGKATKAAFALSKLCYDTLLEDGLKAKISVSNKVVTKALENIIEANTYLSGVGFESCGLAAAHAVHNGFTAIRESHSLYHGEKVAFGTLVQLILENSPLEEIEKVINFCLQVGLPITLSDLGIEEINKDDMMKVAELSCAEGDTMHNMPFEVTEEDVYAAILSADKMGRLYI